MQKFLRTREEGYFRPSRQDELECALCGGGIYEGEHYYRLEGQAVCEYCLERFARRYFSGERFRAGKEGENHDPL